MNDPVISEKNTPAVAPAPEWKPEARQWSWRDVFTAPMLAFKPKCMIVSALTLLALGTWMWLFDAYQQSDMVLRGPIAFNVVEWLWYLVALVIFSIGASLVAVFMKADLLDDEFLSFGEAVTHYKSRILSAILVPVFLVCLLAVTYVGLIYIPVFVAGIPWGIGSVLYVILYPLGYLASLFVILLGIAVWLSIFIFPSIVAIRQHGWFDNVVDTVEAVGTKPHLLVGSLLLTFVMMFVAYAVGFAAMDQLKAQYRTQPSFSEGVRWGDELRVVEAGASEAVNPVRSGFSEYVLKRFDHLELRNTLSQASLFGSHSSSPIYEQDGLSYTLGRWGVGSWQVVIAACILGYVLNLFVAGGMLSYLVVREDDYWDDEDLEDLDKLAKELEEEAKREQAVETSGVTANPGSTNTPTTGDAKPA